MQFNFEINCRKATPGICLIFVTTVSHIPLSKCATDNFGTIRSVEAVLSFVNMFHVSFQVLHYIVLNTKVTEQRSFLEI
jgi:hypothetical protein